jgi:hypothetical protein
VAVGVRNSSGVGVGVGTGVAVGVRNSSEVGVGVGTGVGASNLSGVDSALDFYCLNFFSFSLGLNYISIKVQGNL